uniref:Uncharacterized protein n=1 Tax=Rousettus aegyptiacus TaxID=9407 RepID=A0A7J8E8N4_ROUAE|nr:hypothetical protein HJG63_008230 [Rousettus aegyptiacus]
MDQYQSWAWASRASPALEDVPKPRLRYSNAHMRVPHILQIQHVLDQNNHFPSNRAPSSYGLGAWTATCCAAHAGTLALVPTPPFCQSSLSSVSSASCTCVEPRPSPPPHCSIFVHLLSSAVVEVS